VQSGLFEIFEGRARVRNPILRHNRRTGQGSYSGAAFFVFTLEKGESTMASRTLVSRERETVTMKEVAAMFGVNRLTITRWVKQGLFPKPLQIGKTIKHQTLGFFGGMPQVIVS
jgi:predicted DNA-binding transcriptional regulator AlpA